MKLFFFSTNMRYCNLKGFLVILIIQNSTSEVSLDMSTPTRSPTEVTHQSLPPAPKLPAAETGPVVSPPSLKDVQQAVQKASEQVEGRGAEEVLKELLEKVVEAAFGQAGEEAGDVGEAGEEDKARVQTGKTEHDEEVEMLTTEGGHLGSDGKTEIETAASFEDGGGNGEDGRPRTESIEPLGKKVKQEASLNGTKGNRLHQEENLGETEVQVKDSQDQVALIEERNATERKMEDSNKTSVVSLEVLKESEQNKTGDDSELTLAGKDEEQSEFDREKKTETQMEETIEASANNSEINAEETLREDPREAEGYLLEERTRDGATGTETRETVTLMNEGNGKKEGEPEEMVVEDLHGGEEENQEILELSGPQPADGADVFIGQNPDNQPPTLNPSLHGVKAEESARCNEKYQQGNKIIIPTHNLLLHDLDMAQPTLENSENDVLAEHPLAENEPFGKAGELKVEVEGGKWNEVEEKHGSRETNEQGLRAWKIGATSAAVFLIVETAVIIIYILKCQKKKAPRACSGHVRRPALTLRRLQEASAVTTRYPQETQSPKSEPAFAHLMWRPLRPQKGGQREDERQMAMSNLRPSSAGRGPDSSQTLRTSI